MLMKVLRSVAEGVTRKDDINRKLGTEDHLLDQYLDQLERMGYLSSGGERVQSCEGCPYSRSCGGGCVGAGTRILYITEKGRKALENI